MATGADSRFAAVVETGWRSWWRSAYVLTGDEAVAEDLVTAALVRARRGWRQLEADGNPEAEVHAEVFRVHAARFRPRFAGPPGVPPSGPPPAGPDGLQHHRAELAWAALRDLPAAERAVVVLQIGELADVGGSAAVMGRPARSVAALLLAGFGGLTASVAPSWGSDPSEEAVVAVLSAEVRRRLDLLPAVPTPAPEVLAAVRSDRNRRSRAAVVATVAGVAAIAAAVVVQRPGPSGPTDPVGETTRTGTVQLAGRAWPVAGSMSGDAAAVAELEAALARSSGAVAVLPRVVYAGDLRDQRVVLATDGIGHAWYLHGSRGTSLRLLDGYGRPTAVEALGGPLALLVPRVGPDADLLVVAPEQVRVQVADRPAVWPVERPGYRPLDGAGGLTWSPLTAQAPFALSGTTVGVRGLDSSGTLDGVLFEVPDPDPVVHDYRDASALAARYRGRLEGTVVDAAATAVGAASFGQEPIALSVLATSRTAGCRQAPCSTTSAVVEATVDGVRSRTLAVHTGTASRSPLPIAGSDTSTPSEADLPDHRPLVVGFLPALEGMPVGTMVWADSPHGRITYTVGRGTRSRSAQLDADGYVWLGAWNDVQVVSVEGADGHGRWSDVEP